MDIETVREVISAFQELGGDAKEAFVWYLIVAYLPSYVIGLVWTVGGLFAIHKGIALLRGLLASERLREAAGVSILWRDHEIEKACSVLREHRKSR